MTSLYTSNEVQNFQICYEDFCFVPAEKLVAVMVCYPLLEGPTGQGVPCRWSDSCCQWRSGEGPETSGLCWSTELISLPGHLPYSV